MLNFMADVIFTATRQDRWSPPTHWLDGAGEIRADHRRSAQDHVLHSTRSVRK